MAAFSLCCTSRLFLHVLAASLPQTIPYPVLRGRIPALFAVSNTAVVAQSPRQQEEFPKTSTNPRDLQDPPHLIGGHEVEWEGWKFEWQYREIEGLVLKDVYFQNRKVLKYLGLAEIYVPYATGSPRPVDFMLGGFKANPMPIDIESDCYATGKCQALKR